MEVRSEGLHVRSEKNLAHGVLPRARSRVCFLRVCSSILLWTCLIQLFAVGQLWRPRILNGLSNQWSQITNLQINAPEAAPLPPPFPPSRVYRSNGFLKVSCNGGLNQMRAAICDMVTVARLLNLTLIVPELDKASFWADSSNFEDIFDVNHFIGSLRDEIRIIKRLPKRLNRKLEYRPLVMPPVSWSNENYYLKQILPLFGTYKVIHFNKTDTRLANNGISPHLQKLRCRVNFDSLKFTPEIESLGLKLVNILTQRGPFVALHLRYEMDMLAFSGCTQGCTQVEADELKRMRYTFPWWREKEIVSEERRAQGLCPLTPEETALILQALGFGGDTQIYIASGEIYGREKRLSSLRTAFPLIVKKETVLDKIELINFQNHSSQMAALDYIVSIYSNVFIPTYYGNMARLVEGHRRYLGFRKSVLLERRKLVELLDLNHNHTLSWYSFVSAVQILHRQNMGQPRPRNIILHRPKDEDYFYSNPHECLCPPPPNSTLLFHSFLH